MKKLYIVFALLLTLFSYSQIVTIPDANFKTKLLASSPTATIAFNAAGTRIKIDTNSDGNIQVTEALVVYKLYVSNATITDLTGIQSFTNLRVLDCSTNQISALNISALTSLTELYCSDNLLTSLNLSANTQISNFDCSANSINILNLTNCMNILTLNCNSNLLTSLDVSNRVNLYNLDCGYNALTSLNITNDVALTDLVLTNNQIQNIDLTPCVNLHYLVLNGNPFTSPLNLGNLVNLDSLFAENITGVCPLTDSAMPNLTSLTLLKTDGSSFGNVHYNLIPNLQTLFCRNTGLTNINFIPRNVQSLVIENNQITTMDYSDFTNLTTLNMATNPVTSLTFGNHPGLTTIYASRNNLTDIDVSNLPALNAISVNNCANLVTFNVKNGRTNSVGTLVNCPNLRYICGDDSDLTIIQNAINSATLTNCHVNSYCSFAPGGTVYTIQGNTRFDQNTNGCDASDINFPNLKFTFTNGTVTGILIADVTGAYQNDVQAGTHTFTPVLENPTYFTVSPTTANVTFPASPSPFLRNFCVSPNGTHNDLEVTILPIGGARPGFDCVYKIIYKNKGTNTQSGTVSLTFYDPIEDFVSANPNFTSQVTNTLNWSFSNLNPFESREILVTFNLNSPLETPAVNAGNLITYSATVSGTTDETPADNTSNLTQTVVNSFDPNDKTCVEGAWLPDYEVGKYLHYIIRFENTGTANAENVVVKDIIDTTKLDINTLIPLSGSHTFETKISSPNKVEFIFQNIDLPFDDVNNDGYVAFKIKTLSTLVPGNVINNSASIYFDYNAPIVTATNSVTVFNPLLNNEFEFNSVFALSPVPAKNNLTITAKQDVTMSSLSIYNTLGQVVQVITKPSETIDVSGLKSGSYFIKIISDKGTASAKFVKE